jgi:hypothetical protein
MSNGGHILLLKLNGAYRRQIMTTGAFELCAIKLAKLIPGEEKSYPTNTKIVISLGIVD